MPVSPHDENAGPENAGPKNAGPENAGPAARRSVASAWQRIAMAAAVVAALAGVGYLLATNSSGPAAVWRQAYDPTGHWWLSTVFAALPVLVLLAAIAILQLKAHVSACLGLVAALTVAIAVFHMPARLAMTAAVYGAGYGLFPICWIVLPVIFLYRLTIKAGQFEALQRSLANITEDSRLQLVLIAFALGAFFEGAAGFGTPVAVCGAILISLGFRPLQAAGQHRAGGVREPGHPHNRVARSDRHRHRAAFQHDRAAAGPLLHPGAVLDDLGVRRPARHA
jgi:hypothetical protein